MGRRLKAMGIAALGAKEGVRFVRKGRVIFNGLSRWLARLASLFYDVRRSRSGKVFIQLRDRRREHRSVKRLSRRLHKYQGA